MSYTRIVTLLGALALLAVIAAGPAHRFGLATFQVAFAIMGAGAMAGTAAVGLALVGVFFVKALPQPQLLIVAALLGAAAATPPLLFQKAARGAPPIHDITSDTADPPAFDTLLAQRLKSDNGADYDPDVADVQRVAYPDIRPHPFAGPPDRAFAKALEAANAMGWEIAASDAKAGRIEATATTAWFGFKDDVIVRVRPSGTASVIDVRSVSRVGRGDVGANAKRIREFLARL